MAAGAPRLEYALISHDSALELYNLTQLNPGVIHVTLPPKTRISRERPTWLRLHFADVAENDRAWEQGIPIVSVPRAIEDVAPVHGVDWFTALSAKLAKGTSYARTSCSASSTSLGARYWSRTLPASQASGDVTRAANHERRQGTRYDRSPIAPPRWIRSAMRNAFRSGGSRHHSGLLRERRRRD